MAIIRLLQEPPKNEHKSMTRLPIMPIFSIGFGQDEVLLNIIDLHNAGNSFEVDATYGYGGFYNQIPRPEHRFDIAPKVPGVTVADSRALPLKTASVGSLMFDPPFVVTNHVESEEYLMGQKYGGYRTITELREHYKSSLVEFFRVLKPYGLLVFKCQDFVHGRSNYWIHNEVLDMAKATGFNAVDLFILLARTRFNGAVKKQQHARKYHLYFWVFRRLSGRKAPYVK